MLVECSFEGGVTLQWKRTSPESLALLRKIRERGSETTEGYHLSEMQQCTLNVLESENRQDKLGSRSTHCNQNDFARAEISEQGDNDIKSFTDCSHGKSSQVLVKSAGVSSKNTELSNDRLKTDDQPLEKDGNTNEHKYLKEAEPGSSDVSVGIHADESAENALRNISQIDNGLTTSTKDTCGSIGSLETSRGSDTKECYTKSIEEPRSCKTSSTSRLTNEVLSIDAPFLNPRLFQTSCSDSSSLLPSSNVQLLISTNYVIVAILPQLAYVYHHENEEWKSLLFPSAVKCCCITQG